MMQPSRTEPALFPSLIEVSSVRSNCDSLSLCADSKLTPSGDVESVGSVRVSCIIIRICDRESWIEKKKYDGAVFRSSLAVLDDGSAFDEGAVCRCLIVNPQEYVEMIRDTSPVPVLDR